MSKKIKMVLYAEPGVGKSTFASKSDKPFFVTTDGNYSWLDLPDEDHIQVSSWEESKKVFAELSTDKYAKYNTIVIDLLEDMFKWVEYEYCKKNKINHLSDLGYGKAYDETRNEFYIEIGKLLAIDKHVILLAHGLSKIEKDRRGVELTKYVPSARIPDKVWDMIEGRVRYFLRAFIKGEEVEGGRMIKHRYLSIVPKENEFGIARGLDESNCPEDIDLDWNAFCSVIGVETSSSSTKVIEPTKVEVKIEPKKVEVEVKPEVKKVEPIVETKSEPVPEVVVKAEEPEVKETSVDRSWCAEGKFNPPEEVVEAEEPEVVVEKPTPVPEVKPQPTEIKKEMTQAEKIEAIRAKMAAMRNKQ